MIHRGAISKCPNFRRVAASRSKGFGSWKLCKENLEDVNLEQWTLPWSNVTPNSQNPRWTSWMRADVRRCASVLHTNAQRLMDRAVIFEDHLTHRGSHCPRAPKAPWSASDRDSTAALRTCWSCGCEDKTETSTESVKIETMSGFQGFTNRSRVLWCRYTRSAPIRKSGSLSASMSIRTEMARSSPVSASVPSRDARKKDRWHDTTTTHHDPKAKHMPKMNSWSRRGAPMRKHELILWVWISHGSFGTWGSGNLRKYLRGTKRKTNSQEKNDHIHTKTWSMPPINLSAMSHLTWSTHANTSKSVGLRDEQACARTARMFQPGNWVTPEHLHRVEAHKPTTVLVQNSTWRSLIA